jgi:hypothetical protein
VGFERDLVLLVGDEHLEVALATDASATGERGRTG